MNRMLVAAVTVGLTGAYLSVGAEGDADAKAEALANVAARDMAGDVPSLHEYAEILKRVKR